MREHMDECCAIIHAAIIAGDILSCDGERKVLKEYVQRWAREIAEYEALFTPNNQGNSAAGSRPTEPKA